MGRRNNRYNKNKAGKPNDAQNQKPSGADNGGAQNTQPATDTKQAYDAMCTNDISWYNKKSELFANATRIPFNQIMGLETNLSNQDGLENYNGQRAVPGIMTIKFIPGIGPCSNYADAPNRAFQSLYSALLSKTSTSKLDFTAGNVALLVTCMQSIAMNIGYAKRLIKMSNMYSAQNVYFPRAMLESQIFDGSEIIYNRGDYCWRLNNLIRDFNTLRIPNFIDTFKRHYFLANNAFSDGKGSNCQLYMFVPDGYYIYSDLGLYDEDTDKYDGQARACYYKFGADMGFQDLLDIIETQIRFIRSSSDFTMVNGTLNRAFTDNSFVHIDEVSLDESLVLLNDEAMSYQIHNMVVLNDLKTTTGTKQPNIPILRSERTSTYGDITVDYVEDKLIYAPRINEVLFNPGDQNGFVLNSFSDVVDANWIMETTRLIPVTDGDKVTACGTEFVCGISITTLELTPDGSDYIARRSNVSTFAGGNINVDVFQGAYSVMATDLCALEKFHMAPRFRIINGSTGSYYGTTGDLHFYTVASAEAIDKLHTTALLSPGRCKCTCL